MSHTQHAICPNDIDQLLHSILQDDSSAIANDFSPEVPPSSLESEPMEDEPSSIEMPTQEDSEFSQPLYTRRGRRSHKIKKNSNLASLPQTATKEKKHYAKRLTEVQKLQGTSSTQECIFLEEESSKGSLTSLDGVLGKSCSLPFQLKQALLEERQNIEKTLASANCLSQGKIPQFLPSINYQTLHFKKFNYTAHFWVVESPQTQKDSAIQSRTRNKEKIEPFSVWARQMFNKDGMETYFNNALSRLNSPKLFGMIMELANREEVTAKDKFGHPLIYQDKEANYSPRCPVWSAEGLRAIRMRKRAQLQRRRYIQVEDERGAVKLEARE